MPRSFSGLRALEALYQADPDTFRKFIGAVTTDLGIVLPAVSCPSCGAKLEVNLTPTAKESSRGKRRKHGSQLMDRVIELATLKATMVGNIHSAFTKYLGPKAKQMSKEEYRVVKEKWLQEQIAKEKQRRHKARAA